MVDSMESWTERTISAGILIRSEDGPVCFVPIGQADPDRDMARARMIKALPDLMRAVDGVLAWHKHGGPESEAFGPLLEAFVEAGGKPE